jgi:hypothetical protein
VLRYSVGQIVIAHPLSATPTQEERELKESPSERDYIAAILETDDGKLAKLIETAQLTILAELTS